MSETATQRRAVREKLGFDEDALTGRISDVIAALLAAQAEFPEQYRADAMIEVTARNGWDACDATVEAEVFYERPETDEEMASRLRWDADKKRRSDAQERSEYERLKANFG